MDQGWIKFHRSVRKKAIWRESTPEQKVILMTLLLMATHTERQWEWKGTKYSLQPGQLITSLPSLVEECGKNISVQNIRTALKRFEKYGFLTNESTHQNRLITIVNWDVYQRDGGSRTDYITDSQQTANRQLTSYKNGKNENNVKNNYASVVYDESSDFYNLALALHENIRRNHPDTRVPDLGKWTNDMRSIVENDQRPIEQVHHLIKWSHQHRFWQTVILSPAALRRNWDQLVAQVKQEQEGRRGQVHYLPKRRVDEFVLDLTKGEVW